MNSKNQNGFALPTILIASIVMLTVLIASVVSTAAMSSSIMRQSYEKYADDASVAGKIYADNCIVENAGTPWTNPLSPSTDCMGVQLAACPVFPANAPCHFISVSEGINTTFSVEVTSLDTEGKVAEVSSTGTVNLIRKSDGITWKTFQKTIGFNMISYEETGWKQVSGGGEFMCGIKAADNFAYCWGSGWKSQIGDGFTSQRNVPTAVSRTGVLNGKTIKTISTGYSHSCVIASDDKAYCWGINEYGQLGDGTIGTNRSSPVAVVDTSGPLLGKTIKAIATGMNHTCAIASDDNVYCWGSNLRKELGNGDDNTSPSTLPVAVVNTGILLNKTAKSISSNYYYTCIIANDDLPYCWGQGMYGILGNSITANSNVPVVAAMTGPLSGRTIKSITAGYYHTCVIADNDLGYCWGYNGGTPGSFDDSAGALGNNSTVNSLTPVAISMTGNLVGKTLKKIDSDSYHSCALASDDLVYCWGYNPDGILGINSTTDPILVPTPVYMGVESALYGKTVKNFATGDYVDCAISYDGSGACWGVNILGGYGNDTTVTGETIPISGMNL